jgi:TPR repeat protein
MAERTCRKTTRKPFVSTKWAQIRVLLAHQYHLGCFYEAGLGGLRKDESEAAQRFKLAANKGYAPAQLSLARYCEQGRGGLAKDDNEAARLLKLAADQGDAKAQAELAELNKRLPK